MKKLKLFMLIILLASCSNNESTKNAYIKKDIRVSSITGNMKCENCGMNLKTNISTSHALKTKNGKSHFYCSLNCSTMLLHELKDSTATVYAVDYGETQYYPVDEIHYVIGSSLKEQ